MVSRTVKLNVMKLFGIMSLSRNLFAQFSEAFYLATKSLTRLEGSNCRFESFFKKNELYVNSYYTKSVCIYVHFPHALSMKACSCTLFSRAYMALSVKSLAACLTGVGLYTST